MYGMQQYKLKSKQNKTASTVHHSQDDEVSVPTADLQPKTKPSIVSI